MRKWRGMMCAFFGVWLAMGVGFASEPATADGGGLDPAIFARDFFPLLTWDPQHGWRQDAPQRKNGLASIAECGFNIGGFVLPRDLPECERLGIKAIVAPDVPNLSTWMRAWKSLPDAEIEARVRRMIEEAGKSPAILGYFLTDEPGTSAFPALGKAVAAVRKYAPGKLAYINLFPSYATIGAKDTSQLQAQSYTEYLERYVAEVKPQFISYDNYQVEHSMDMKIQGRAANYYTNLLEVRRVAREHGLPFWNIVSSNQIRPATTIPSPANLRFQAYTTLAAGGRGLTWYTYYGASYGYAPVGKDGERTTTWNYLQSVNREVRALGPLMNRLESTGVGFSAPAPVPGLPSLPGAVVDAVECDAPLMVGEFRHEDGTPRVMLVNLSLEQSAKVTPKRNGKPIEGVYYSAQDGRELPVDYEHGLWLTAGQGVLVRPGGGH